MNTISRSNLTIRYCVLCTFEPPKCPLLLWLLDPHHGVRKPAVWACNLSSIPKSPQMVNGPRIRACSYGSSHPGFNFVFCNVSVFITLPSDLLRRANNVYRLLIVYLCNTIIFLGKNVSGSLASRYALFVFFSLCGGFLYSWSGLTHWSLHILRSLHVLRIRKSTLPQRPWYDLARPTWPILSWVRPWSCIYHAAELPWLLATTACHSWRTYWVRDEPVEKIANCISSI